MRQTVTLSKGKIGEFPVLFIHFNYCDDLVEIARKLGAIWSPERRIWHIPFSRIKLQEAQWAFRGLARVVYHGVSQKRTEPPAPIRRGKQSKQVRRIGAEN